MAKDKTTIKDKIKQCSKCKENKNISEFWKNSGKPDGFSYECKLCKNQYRKNNHSRLNIKRKDRVLQQEYGITFDDYKKIWISQEGCCAICKTFQTEVKNKRALCVDHNHMTNEVRGLLCEPCNLMLGVAKENCNILQCAIEYIKKWNK